MNVEAKKTFQGSRQNEIQTLKNLIHHQLMGRINLKVIEELSEDEVRGQITAVVRDLMEEQTAILNESERKTLIDDILNEVLGLGPLESLLADPSVSDILVNNAKNVYIERHGVLEKTHVHFEDDDHLLRIIEKIATGVGRRIDESVPMVDARLPDGSRVNAVIPPLSLDGPSLSIRKFSIDPYTVKDLLNFKTMTKAMAKFLAAAVKSRVNILISGGTGSGKTTLLNVVSSSIPITERIVTIEDSAELQLQQPHVVRLETRPPNIEGTGAIKQRDLLRNCLRMRPDRIVIGEVRGGEAIDMLQAMNTGHDGSLSTIHANSPRDALTRLEHMVGMGEAHIPPLVIRQQIAAAIDLVVHTERLADGHRVVTSIQEITGMEDSVVNMQEIFSYKRSSVDGAGRVVGKFQATGIRPTILNRIRERGIELDERIFDENYLYE
ncbi:CpaF family protein [Litorivivens sp.]|uniref:CpaF family protein n=1 Tax=Litorivivens sp. TaxID=2020868 RepID=UPI00356A2A74